MKWALLLMSLLTQLFFSAAALAMPVTVDFNQVVNPPGDITTGNNPVGITLSGVTFRYDNFGNDVDFAMVDQKGILGTTGGSLIFDFGAPTTALNLDFSLLLASASIPDALFIGFSKGGAPVSDTMINAIFDPALIASSGMLAFKGPEFDQALMLFSVAVPFFTVSNISYEPASAPIPEPATVILLATGLIGIIGWRQYGQRC